ncbi:MoaD/ThiS family protein [Ovoidimarina sediminis]|uniref:MoaD/ThiS family protein n=1 Tax=Ovoidimarina sediminis TaxID=3079856 RepID=UPI00290689CD|nr:MoaD/ThiS family protein [Rhodophyticola sp. MJ-SS7]MDU8945257.1 MoaD/ThiS family protein [Rhodophyticola sp. MJ-SS7]
MIRVKLWGSLRSLADDQDEVEIDARTLKDVRDALSSRFPRLKPQIDRGVSFAVDGLIYRDDWLLDVTKANEIVMMPRMVGG